MFRLISWNVAGRVKKLAAQMDGLAEYKPDVIALQEVTATTIPLWRRELEERDYHIITSLNVAPNYDELVGGRRYGVLMALRWPVELLSPTDFGVPWPERVLSVIVNSPFGEIECHNVHLPAGVSHGMIKVETFEVFTNGFVEAMGTRAFCVVTSIHRKLSQQTAQLSRSMPITSAGRKLN